MREVQLWEGSLEDAFADIHALAAGCHFRDCRHDTEPRCAVAAAAEHGGLDPARLDSFRRLQRELDAQARRQDELLMLQDKKKNKVIHKAMRNVTKIPAVDAAGTTPESATRTPESSTSRHTHLELRHIDRVCVEARGVTDADPPPRPRQGRRRR